MVLCTIHNRFLLLLYKVLDNGLIPTVRQVDEVLEELCVMYYRELKQDDDKTEGGDSDGEGDGGVQTFQMDDFHPNEFYIL